VLWRVRRRVPSRWPSATSAKPAVVATFAMGTALGDLTAVTFHLGYFASGIMFAGLILIPAIGCVGEAGGEPAAEEESERECEQDGDDGDHVGPLSWDRLTSLTVPGVGAVHIRASAGLGPVRARTCWH